MPPNANPQPGPQPKDITEAVTTLFTATAKGVAGVYTDIYDGLSIGSLGGVEGVQPKNLHRAGKAVIQSVKLLRSLDKQNGFLSKRGIKLRRPSFYAALAIKESRFDPSAESYSGAAGLFQLMDQTRKDAGKMFKFKVSRDDILLTEEESSTLEEQDAQAQMQNNAMLGILYWSHIRYEAMFDREYVKITLKTEEDYDKMAAFMYNVGPTATAKMWESVMKPQKFDAKGVFHEDKKFTYEDFEKALSLKLAGLAKMEELPPKKHAESGSYGVYFDTYVTSDIRPHLFKGDKPISITFKTVKRPSELKKGKKREQSWVYKTDKLLSALDYVAVIEGIRKYDFISP